MASIDDTVLANKLEKIGWNLEELARIFESSDDVKIKEAAHHVQAIGRELEELRRGL